jgi:hypothetical protein
MIASLFCLNPDSWALLESLLVGYFVGQNPTVLSEQLLMIAHCYYLTLRATSDKSPIMSRGCGGALWQQYK